MSLKKSIISLVVALVPFVVSAQSSEALSFIRINQDAYRAALAGAGSVSTDANAAWAAWDNPTAALNADKINVAAGLNLWSASKSSYYSLAYAQKFGSKLAVTAGLSIGTSSPYDVYSSTGKKTGTFTPSDQLINIGLAYQLSSKLALGVNVHSATQVLAENAKYSALAFDCMLSTELYGVKAAAGLVGIGPKVKSVSGVQFPIPGSVKIALGYEAEANILSYGAYLDADYFLFSQSIGTSIGAKLCYKDFVDFKAGYHLNVIKSSILPSYASLGAGVKVGDFKLDLALLLGSTLNGTILGTIAYSF